MITFQIELFADSLLLLLHNNTPETKKLVTKLINIYETETKSTPYSENDYFSLYIDLISVVKDKNLTIKDQTEINNVLLKLKTKPQVVKDPELYTNLKNIFTVKEPLTEDQIKVYIRRLTNMALWYDNIKQIKRMFGKLVSNTTLRDVDRQTSILNELNTVCSEMVQENQSTLKQLDADKEEHRVQFLDSEDKENILKALRVMKNTETVNTFKMGLQGLNKAIGGGVRLGSSIVINSLPHAGKCCTNDTPIRVPGGWKPIGEMKVGDTVTAWDGTPSKVIGVFPQGVKQVYRVTFIDGRYLDTCAEHLWTTYHYSNSPSYKNLGERVRKYVPELMSTMDIINRFSGSAHAQRNTYVPLCISEKIDDVDLPLDPYLLGVLLGDGYFSTCRRDEGVVEVSTDLDIIKRIQLRNPWIGDDGIRISEEYPNAPWCVKARFIGTARTRIVENLKALGLMGRHAWEKFIPEIYKNASNEQRLEILRGLFDTDGNIDRPVQTPRGISPGTYSFCTTSKQMADDFLLLLRSIGAIAYYSTKHPFFTMMKDGVKIRRNGRDAYVFRIRYDHPEDLFTLKRKTNNIVPRINRGLRNKLLRIVSVVPLPKKEECTCIAIDHPDKLYVAKDYIVTHNSLVLLKFLRWHVTLNKPMESIKNPTAILYSLENETPQNLVQLFEEMYINKFHQLPPKDLTDEQIAGFCYDEFKQNGWRLIIDRRLGANFGFAELVANFNEYVAAGYTPMVVVIDYMNMMRKGRNINEASDANHLLVRELYTNVCNFLKANNCTLVTAHQLNRKAAEAARLNPMGAVKRFSVDMLSDAIDPQREVDVAIYIHKEFDAVGRPWLTFKVDKVRYETIDNEDDKYFAYLFDGPKGILDDVNGECKAVKNINAAPVPDEEIERRDSIESNGTVNLFSN